MDPTSARRSLRRYPDLSAPIAITAGEPAGIGPDLCLALAATADPEQLLFIACPEPATGQDRPAPSWLWSFDPDTGERLFRHDLQFTRLPIPPPVRIDEDPGWRTPHAVPPKGRPGRIQQNRKRQVAASPQALARPPRSELPVELIEIPHARVVDRDDRV